MKTTKILALLFACAAMAACSEAPAQPVAHIRARGEAPAGNWLLQDGREWYAKNHDAPAGKLWASHEGPDWLPWICENIVDHKVTSGMTPEQVKLALGAPAFVNKITAAYGPEWAYHKHDPPVFVYFAHGRVDRVD